MKAFRSSTDVVGGTVVVGAVVVLVVAVVVGAVDVGAVDVDVDVGSLVVVVDATIVVSPELSSLLHAVPPSAANNTHASVIRRRNISLFPLHP
jgi:hypothetical protein